MVMFEDPGFYERRIEAVVADEIDPQVIWEQRVKDAGAERERRVVTSPGFSFSAAGLLFPYHLGVAEFLIEKGYIKVLKFILYFHFLAWAFEFFLVVFVVIMECLTRIHLWRFKQFDTKRWEYNFLCNISTMNAASAKVYVYWVSVILE